MAYRGTLIIGGSGVAVVVATGINTELGTIQSLVDETESSKTPLQRQTHELSNVLVYGSLGLGLGMIGICALYKMAWVETLQVSLSMTVAAIPEGLPVLVTLSLAHSARSMKKDKVLVRNLDAIETLGSTHVLCLDKTGTLTQNKMSVVSLFSEMKVYDWLTDLENLLTNIHTPEFEALLRLLQVAVLCNDTKIDTESEFKKIKWQGSPTERALIEMASDAGVDVHDLRARFPLKHTEYRTENKSYMQTMHTHPEHEHGSFLAIKGSPSQVLELCSKYIQDGKVRKLTLSVRKKILIQNESMGASALRVLGLAYSESREGEAHDLVWLGLVGMKDRERPEAKELIHSLHRAGIKPVMITGDQGATARALAVSLGFAQNDEELNVCDFAEWKHLDDKELEVHALKAHVFARVAPSDKLRIVQILKSQSKIVAMVGDGINDTPALKASHIGVAMGKRGADVARDVANVVILDDNLNALIPAIERGRGGYDSIRRAILFLLATNFSEILLMVSAASMGLGQALHPLQILWINLISDLFPALALALEGPHKDVLQRGPHDPHAPLMNGADFRRIGGQASLMAALSLIAFGIGRRGGAGPRAQSMAFLTLTSAQLLHTFSSRSVDQSILETLFTKSKLPNAYIGLSVASGFALQGVPFASQTMRRVFGLGSLGLGDVCICGVLALSNFLGNEIYRGLKASRKVQHDGDEDKR